MSQTSTAQKIELYTDGACLGNPGPGGWAYILKNPANGGHDECSGGEGRTTNNRMELTAVIEGLKALKKQSQVLLVADSQYVLLGIRDWMPGWKKRGWRKSNKAPVLNVELWQELDALLAEHDVTVEWTRGHAGHPENERCDALASAEAKRLQ